MNQKKVIEITPVNRAFSTVHIRGISPLLCNRMSPEKLMAILESHEKGKSTVREKRNVKKEFKNSLYSKKNGNYTFPGIAIKNAVTDCAKTYAPDIHKTQVRGSFYVPEFIEIVGSEPEMLIDRGNDARGTLKVNVRSKFEKWESTFEVEFNASGVLSLDQLLNLINLAGYSIGIGDHRPQCNGTNGRFEVVLDKKK